MMEYILLAIILAAAVAYLIVRYYKIFTGKKRCCDGASACQCSGEGKASCRIHCSCGSGHKSGEEDKGRG